MILLLNLQRSDPLADLALYLELFPQLIRQNRLALGLVGGNAASLQQRDVAAEVAKLAQGQHWHPPIFNLTLDNSRDLVMLVRGLLFQVDPESRERGQ